MTTSPDRFHILHLAACDSTSDYLRRQIARLDADFPLMVSADVQTAGRGREGRRWHSPEGLGIYATFGFHLDDGRALPLLSIAAGVAVIDMLQEWGGGTFSLKWPNDVLAEGRKAAGVLCETIVRGERVTCLAGIGVNLNQRRQDFPAELQHQAVSLRMLSGREWSVAEGRELLAAAFCRRLRQLSAGEADLVLERARELGRSFLGRQVRFRQGGKTWSGVCRGLADDGGFRLETPAGGETVLYSGEMID